MRRRSFLKKTGLSALLLGLGHQYARAFTRLDVSPVRLSILHTNDLHGYFDSASHIPTHRSLQNLIQQIRSESEHSVLLLDAGNHFGSTEEVPSNSIQVMKTLAYDAVCMGNEDMKMGFYHLSKQYEHVNFPVLSSNYILNNTTLQSNTTPFTTLHRAGIKIGIFALNKPSNSVNRPNLNQPIATQDALVMAQQLTRVLRHQENCQLIICLSQLGLTNLSEEISDLKIAAQVPGIDIILGGGTRTFMSEAIEIQNINNQRVILSQAGHDGILLGQLDIEIQPGGGVQLLQSRYLNTRSSPFY